MHNPEPFPVNETYITLWDFKIQSNLLILSRRPDQVIISKKKENLPFIGFCRSDLP